MRKRVEKNEGNLAFHVIIANRCSHVNPINFLRSTPVIAISCIIAPFKRLNIFVNLSTFNFIVQVTFSIEIDTVTNFFLVSL